MAETAYAFEGTPVPPGAVDTSLDLLAEIKRLKQERNAVILAHYYQTPDIQDIADFVGDSLDLSRQAASTNADVIAFCGVKFMAEVAKIMSPNKQVVLPDILGLQYDRGWSAGYSGPEDHGINLTTTTQRLC